MRYKTALRTALKTNGDMIVKLELKVIPTVNRI